MAAERESEGRPPFNLSIGGKFIGLTVVLLSLMLAAAIYSFLQSRSADAEVELVGNVLEPLSRDIDELEQRTADEALAVERALRYGGPQVAARPRAEAQMARFAQLAGEVDRLLALATRHIRQFQGAATRTEVAVALGKLELEAEAVRREHKVYGQAARQLFHLSAATPRDRVTALEAEVSREEQQLIAALQRMAREANVLARAGEQRAAAMEHRSLLVSKENLALAVFAFLLGNLLALLFTRRVLDRVRRLIAGTEEVRRGNLDVALPVSPGDEIAQLTSAFSTMVGELRTKAAMRRTFSSYMDPRVVDRLLSDGREALEAGEKRRMTVFFADLQGFSSISETLTAASLIKLVNRYLALASEPIRNHQGVIDKYIGDAVMAYWGEPFTDGDHALNACRAALAQRLQIGILQLELPELLGLRKGVPSVSARVGLATGDVVMGSIGSATSKSFTIMGDTVNVASRLEGANKIYGTAILADAATIAEVGPMVEVREIDLLTAAGKSEPIRVFELIGEAGTLTPEHRELRDTYHQGLAAYRACDWDAAEAGFRTCLRIVADDGPARVLLDRIAGFRARPPAGDWDGAWHSEAK